MKKERYLLVDGNNLLYSSYHVAQKFSQAGQLDTSFFFLRVLLSILKKKLHEKIVVFFDGGGKNFRKELSLHYKANRPKMPEELFQQLTEIKEILSLMGINCLQMINHEADDLIASFIKKFDHPDRIFDIFTRDKDLLQILKENVNVIKYSDKKLILYSEKDFINDYSFSPKSFLSYLSILGDSSDNILGIKGIGQVNAKKLISAYSDLLTVHNNLNNIHPSSLARLFASGYQTALANQELISLDDSIDILLEPIVFYWEDLKNNSQLREFCLRKKFISILKSLTSID